MQTGAWALTCSAACIMTLFGLALQVKLWPHMSLSTTAAEVSGLSCRLLQTPTEVLFLSTSSCAWSTLEIQPCKHLACPERACVILYRQ